MRLSLLKKIGEGLERVFCTDGKVICREILLAEDLTAGGRAVLEVLKTNKGTLYLHSNLQETHTYFKCTANDLKVAAAMMLKVVEREADERT